MILKKDAQLILASGSPRRKALLEDCGLAFKVLPSGSEEGRIGAETPKEMVERLALLKARSISEANPDAWVIGCDTDVYIGDSILGKPNDEADARAILSRIQGTTHSVWGAFAILHGKTRTRLVRSHETLVTLCPMSAAQIEAYVRTGEPMDKAGAYAAQGLGAQFVESVQGSYTNVVGLNICALIHELRELGIIHDG